MKIGTKLVGLLLATALTAPAAAAIESQLAPYQMVRSLQLVQDRIAAGDHAAIPMQRKLLEMIDARFQDTESEDFNDLKNFRAMLVYAMSGGNPRTIETALARIHLDETNRTLGIGILSYLRGNYKTAKAVFEDVDPLTIEPDLGAFFALVKGTVNSVEDPAAALGYFAQARLLSPGTLIEEAALRRTMALTSNATQTKEFFDASEQYVRRFLTSPYASQFADTFVAGVLKLNEATDRDALRDVVSGMEPAQQKTIYLRLARRSAIDGNKALAAFASEQAEAIQVAGFGPDGDPRAELYASLATVSSENVTETLERLKKIDRKKLSPNDLKLLEAAEDLASQVTKIPVAEAPAPVATAPAPVVEATDEADLIPEGEPLPASHKETAEAKHDMAEPLAPPSAKVEEVKPVQLDEADAKMADTRRRLDDVDKLLGETAQ